MSMAQAWRLRWVAVAICFSAVFVFGPLAGDVFYWLSGDDVHDDWVYAASLCLHFLAAFWIIGWPVLRYRLTGRES